MVLDFVELLADLLDFEVLFFELNWVKKYVFIGGFEFRQEFVNVVFEVAVLFPEELRFLFLLKVGVVEVGQDLEQF